MCYAFLDICRIPVALYTIWCCAQNEWSKKTKKFHVAAYWLDKSESQKQQKHCNYMRLPDVHSRQLDNSDK